MIRAVLADTGSLYAAVDCDDQYHARAQEQLQALADQRLSVVLAYPILLETYTLIRYRLGSASASGWLKDVRDGGAWVNPNPQDYHHFRVSDKGRSADTKNDKSQPRVKPHYIGVQPVSFEWYDIFALRGL